MSLTTLTVNLLLILNFFNCFTIYFIWIYFYYFRQTNISHEETKDVDAEEPRRPPPRLKSPSRGRSQLQVSSINRNTTDVKTRGPVRGAASPAARHSVAGVPDHAAGACGHDQAGNSPPGASRIPKLRKAFSLNILQN